MVGCDDVNCVSSYVCSIDIDMQMNGDEICLASLPALPATGLPASRANNKTSEISRASCVWSAACTRMGAVKTVGRKTRVR